jgi:hypothetical protein
MTWPGVRAFAAGALLVAAGCTMRSPGPRLEPALRQPLVFRWTEVTPLDATAPSHHGGVVFLVRSDTVYSVAWPDPAHDFYHAECRCEIAADLGGFHCEYLQRVDAPGRSGP